MGAAISGFINTWSPSFTSTLNRIDGRNVKILDYLRTWVGENNQLSQEEKEALLNGTLSNDVDNLIDADNYPKWNRLFSVILGMQREKQELVENPAPFELAAAL